MYPTIRKYVISKLILFNGRRVNEIPNMKIRELEAAINNEYVSKEKTEPNNDDDNQKMIAYVKGKNPAKPVDVIFQGKMVPLLAYLANKSVRSSACIPETNNFVFSSKNSISEVS